METHDPNCTVAVGFSNYRNRISTRVLEQFLMFDLGPNAEGSYIPKIIFFSPILI